MHADLLQRLVLEAPTPGAAASALEVLDLLARDGDFHACRSLAAALAAALGFDPELVARAAGPAEALGNSEIPALLRLYLAGQTPRFFLSEPERCSALASEVDAKDELYRAQRLVLRDDPLQHEAMKAYLLTAFAKFVGGSLDLLSPAGELRILDSILRDTRVVPGDAMEAGFLFGRDKILTLTQRGLSFVLSHELGHHVFNDAMAGSDSPSTQNAAIGDSLSTATGAELASALPGLVTAAYTNPSELLKTRLTNGLSFAVSLVTRETGTYLHMSLTQAGGPIVAANAADYALLVLEAIGTDPDRVSAAMSPRGVFHFGTTECGFERAKFKRRLKSQPPEVSGLRNRSAAWLARLAAAGRLTESADDIPVTLGVAPRRPRYFMPEALATEDLGIVAHLRAQPDGVQIAPADLKRLVSAAVAVGDNALLVALLEAGGDAVSVEPENFARAGASLGIADDGTGVKKFFGTAPEGVLLVLHTLRSYGGDIDAPHEGRTLLTSAARRAPKAAAALLALGAHPNRRDANSETPLHAAVLGGNAALVETLLTAGAEVQATDRNGAASLHVAIMLRNAACAEVLLRHGADPNSVDFHGVTALMNAPTADLASLLLRAGANLDARDSTSATPLLHAARRGLTEVIAALLAAGADPEAAGAYGATALHFVAQLFDEEAQEGCFKALLAAGADVDEETGDGLTPLMVAARAGRPNAMRFLLARGADPNARSLIGQTALILACDPSAQWDRSFDRIERLKQSLGVLAEAKADLNAADEEGLTALFLATQMFDASVVDCVLELGADPNVRTKLGMTPLMSAARKLHPAMVETLIGAGADVDTRDAKGDTALFYAMRRETASGYRENNISVVVNILLDHGADPGLHNNTGESAASLAQIISLADDVEERIAATARRQGGGVR